MGITHIANIKFNGHAKAIVLQTLYFCKIKRNKEKNKILVRNVRICTEKLSWAEAIVIRYDMGITPCVHCIEIPLVVQFSENQIKQRSLKKKTEKTQQKSKSPPA